MFHAEEKREEQGIHGQSHGPGGYIVGGREEVRNNMEAGCGHFE